MLPVTQWGKKGLPDWTMKRRGMMQNGEKGCILRAVPSLFIQCATGGDPEKYGFTLKDNTNGTIQMLGNILSQCQSHLQ